MNKINIVLISTYKTIHNYPQKLCISTMINKKLMLFEKEKTRSK